jgi:RHS repeat-associated protein
VDADGQPLLGLQTSATRFVDGQAYTSATPTYDDAYRPLTTTVTLPNIAEFSALESRAFTTEYSYAADGQVASVALPAVVSDSGVTALGAETVTTRYDTASMPSWMSGGFGWGTYVAQSRFAADGRAIAADLGNTYGAVVSYRYEDGTNRLTGIYLTRQGYDAELALTYGYDAAGNVTSLSDQASATPALQDNQCFGYDGLRRLEVAWTAGNGDCDVAQSAITSTDVGGAEPYWAEYGYDALGNRVSLVERAVGGSPSTVTTTYQHGAGGASPHQVTSVMSSVEGSPLSDVAFEYDDAGNRVAATSGAETHSYAWDVEGELVADGDYEYVYDASGSRIVRSGADGVTVYLPGGQEITIEGTAVSATRYYSFAGSTVAVRSGKGLGGVTSLVSDRDGSVVAAVPNTVWTTSSVERVYADPFGGIRGGSDAGVPGDRRFLGATLDADSGLTLLGARYYDAALGRFISVDPLLNLGVPSHFNAYSYAYGNPMTFSDPTGMEPAGEKIGLGKNSGGGGGKKPPSTSWAALAACSDFWCQQGWHFSTSVRSAIGVVKGLGGLVWEASTVKVVVEDVIPMISDWDGYWARYNEQLQADVDFWSGPDPVGELGNAIWSSLSGAWQNDPGMLIGEGVAFGGTAVIPGVLPIKVVSAANKVGNAVTTAARACSFTGATVVLMATGELKPIASVVVGDLVVASDPETGEQEAEPVEQVFVHEDVVFDLVIGDEVISTTEDHPFWSVTDHRFERADELEPGELVLSAAGAVIEVSGVAAGSTRTALAYNLAVEDIHTFHVGASKVLVHNTCGLPGALPMGPAPERVWNVLDRVDDKGAALQGYSGGSVFQNRDGLLPGGVSYREWDVNPNVPGVDRGPERLVTGSDGAAYFTTDHYESFIVVRGPTG